MITEIWSFIATRTGLVKGTELLVGHRTQDAPDECSVVMESGGGGIVPDLVDRVDKMIQILTRAKTYFTAHDNAWVIYNALYRDHEYGSAGWSIPAVAPAVQDYVAMIIEPVSDPAYIGQDEKGRFEFSTNYQFLMRNDD
jgi:hypothetical protein